MTSSSPQPAIPPSYANGPEILEPARQRRLVSPRSRPDLTAADFRVQHYRGRSVLTWWRGTGLEAWTSGRLHLQRPLPADRHGQRRQRSRADRREFLIIAPGTRRWSSPTPPRQPTSPRSAARRTRRSSTASYRRSTSAPARSCSSRTAPSACPTARASGRCRPPASTPLGLVSHQRRPPRCRRRPPHRRTCTWTTSRGKPPQRSHVIWQLGAKALPASLPCPSRDTRSMTLVTSSPGSRTPSRSGTAVHVLRQRVRRSGRRRHQRHGGVRAQPSRPRDPRRAPPDGDARQCYDQPEGRTHHRRQPQTTRTANLLVGWGPCPTSRVRPSGALLFNAEFPDRRQQLPAYTSVAGLRRRSGADPPAQRLARGHRPGHAEGRSRAAAVAAFGGPRLSLSRNKSWTAAVHGSRSVA